MTAGSPLSVNETAPQKQFPLYSLMNAPIGLGDRQWQHGKGTISPIPMSNRLAQLAALAGSALCLGDVAVAQQVPNAGSILRQLEPETPSLPALKAQSAPQPAPEAVPSGPALHVRGFRIEGNH